MIMDMKEMKMLLMPEQKMYMEYPLSRLWKNMKRDKRKLKVRITDETKINVHLPKIVYEEEKMLEHS
jgi:hypothetical protein